MSAPSNVNPGHSNLQLTHGTPLSQPTTPRSASILNNATNNQINNNVFTTNNTNTTNISSSASPLALLYQFVAPNAILNSGGRADEVRCHPGTREEVISLVEKSISQEYSGPRMLWLSGPAGAGKSAIMQTVAERCKDRGVPHANFFFFRADSSRRDARAFVATIMHQIIKYYPSVAASVEATLASDPLLFRMGVQQQFHELLHQALATMHDTLPPLPPLALLIDGLDECDSETKTEQRQLLQALDTLLIQKGLHFRLVVASRVEPQISMAFGQLRSEVDSIFLDEKYSPEKDIHRFVTAEFDKIRLTHYLAFTLGPEWPSESDVADIVSKSSGQFIFAATVMRFISHSPASPILSLQKVQRIVPPNKNSPFAQLDAIYTYILGQVEDLAAVQVILAIRLLSSRHSSMIPQIMLAYQPRFSQAVFDSCLSELAPLVNMESGGLEFFHASFPDFLCDRTRSGEYYINLETFSIGAFPIWWRHRSSLSLNIASVALKQIRQSTSEITTALVECNITFEDLTHGLSIKDFVEALHRIYAANDLETFNKIIYKWPSGGVATFIPKTPLRSTPEAWLSTFQTGPSTFYSRPSTSHSYPSTSQAFPPTLQARPLDRQALPLIPATLLSTSQTPPPPHGRQSPRKQIIGLLKGAFPVTKEKDSSM